jgi:hypothetical protein
MLQQGAGVVEKRGLRPALGLFQRGSRSDNGIEPWSLEVLVNETKSLLIGRFHPLVNTISLSVKVAKIIIEARSKSRWYLVPAAGCADPGMPGFCRVKALKSAVLICLLGLANP